ncbi:peptide chain release factor 1 [Magnetococcales bacterium HHB-1]
MSVINRLRTMAKRHAELNALLGDPEVIADSDRLTLYSKEFAELDPVVEQFNHYMALKEELEETEELLSDAQNDAEMRQMAKEERELLKEKIDQSFDQLRLMLLPADPNDGKNIILEIRAGTGGEEAALFVADLFRMYSRFAETKRWKVDILSSSPTPLGGFKELIAQISGNRIYSELKFESGVHRVQRIPQTEAGGRIHTSACTVAILPEADDVDVKIDESELRIDVYRSSGPGGQSVNTTDSAVRITHVPTGLVVTCQDEKSQLKNKTKALKVLKARLLDQERSAAAKERSDQRKDQVGSGDRSERIRTYNFPQGRVTDHRVQLTLHKLDQVLQGDMAEIISALITNHQANLLSQLS